MRHVQCASIHVAKHTGGALSVMTSPTSSEIKRRAQEAGFARVGVARAGTLENEGRRLREWIDQEHHGTMKWMADTVDVRIDPRDPRMVEDAASVVVLAAPYARAPEAIGPAPGVVARYARGRDYHNVLTKRLRKLVTWLREIGYPSRGGTDSMPIFERAWAERAGVGFIGKNCCLIVPGLGSHLFLATIVTTLQLEPDAPMRERCGECTRCLDACPTKAFLQPRSMDARRCISYLTIEHPGAISLDLRAPIGMHFLGCDICQDVCPFNRTALPPASQTDPFAPDPRWSEIDAAALLTMSEDDFDRFSLGSPVRRLGRSRAARNAAIVLGNRGERRALPVLQHATRDPDPDVRSHARWAIERIHAQASEEGDSLSEET